jgi:hypothetical protein
LALGADRIVLGEHAELGPLDAQVFDQEREDAISALDEVQILDRLHSFALQAVDAQMILLTHRTERKVSSLLPEVQRFVAAMLRPLFEKIDTVHYTRMSRVLRVAEEYAVRLLQPRHDAEKATAIARRLVHKYPDHAFVVDSTEAARIGLVTESATGNLAEVLDVLVQELPGTTVLGRLVEGRRTDGPKE